MLTDTIEVSGLSESVVKAVGERAKEVGVATEDYVRYLIEEDVAFVCAGQGTNQGERHFRR
jgi:hypothetical protein